MNPLRPTMLLALAAHVSTAEAGALGRLTPGHALPDVTLPALDDGRPASLRALCRGRRTILVNFASW